MEHTLATPWGKKKRPHKYRPSLSSSCLAIGVKLNCLMAQRSSLVRKKFPSGENSAAWLLDTSINGKGQHCCAVISLSKGCTLHSYHPIHTKSPHMLAHHSPGTKLHNLNRRWRWKENDGRTIVPEYGKQEVIDRCDRIYKDLQHCSPSRIGDVGEVVRSTDHVSHDARGEGDVEG